MSSKDETNAATPQQIDLTRWMNENKETLKECVAFSHEYVIHERNVDVLIAELKRCYEREDMIIRALKGTWIGNTCWHQPSENLEDIAETRGSTLGHIASLLRVDVNRQDIHDFDNGCGGENCDHNASE